MEKSRIEYFEWLASKENDLVMSIWLVAGGAIDCILLPSHDNNFYTVILNKSFIRQEVVRSELSRLFSKFPMLAPLKISDTTES